MMGDYFSDVSIDDTDINEDTSNIWDISNISIPDSPDERTFSVIPKTRSPISGRSNTGEEKDGNLKTTPILKYYKILGPPRISAGQRKFDIGIHVTDNGYSDNDASTRVEPVQQNEPFSPSSAKTRQTSQKNLRRILTQEVLSEFDKIPEEEECTPNESVTHVPIISTPTKDLSDTLTSFKGIRLLGMSIE
ncbi:uncharacterized protein LOC132546914 [Ylistrum balloti]|uniref:uncharacterized protein LOC132546914 n=1 Tax=Ylistrum balloti TaxID=509963 RepID=UPI002905D07B|nr:uncharacterized protein LOC132546914 [Ylistrum balloti]